MFRQEVDFAKCSRGPNKVFWGYGHFLKGVHYPIFE